GTAVEALIAEPALQRREDPRELRFGVAAALLDRADEPFTPLPAFAFQHRMNEIGLRAEQFVERGFRSTGFLDDGVDAGGVDAVLAERMGRCGEEAAACGLIVAGSDGFFLRS